MYDFQSERWNEFELPKLALRELLALAKLLGCPSRGSKETVIVRLLDGDVKLCLVRLAKRQNGHTDNLTRSSRANPEDNGLTG
jgi:hypothetical protein